LNRTINLVDKLLVYPEKMKENLNITLGLPYSQKVLIALANSGMKRQEAYVLVQQAAMRTWNEKKPFMETLLENDELMSHITKEELEKLFTHDEIFESVDFIFDRCGL